MTRDIRAARDRLGLKTSELGRLVGVSERTALRWVKGERAMPEPVWRLLEMVMNRWKDHSPQTIANCLKQGYSIDISPPTEAQKAERMSPAITLTYVRPPGDDEPDPVPGSQR